MKVLNKGLKYTPTPPADTDTLSVDIKEFCRKLRLKNHFGDKESKTADESIVRNKSTFTPEKGKNKDLDLYINHLSNFPLIPKPQDKVKNNLPFKQQQALYRLQKDESIIIKEADKGGALVIMDRIYYRDKIQEQLNDKQYYRELNDNMEKKTKRNINKLISKFPHCTTEKEVDYLTKFEVKTSNFYGLPKIHKTEVKEDAILVSFDVTSLYTNIPHKLGLDAVKFWLESYRHIIDQRFSNNFLLEGLKIILDNNTFFFDGKYYLQISGTAMGTKVAPTYATLVMGFLEDKMYQQVESEFDTAFKVRLRFSSDKSSNLCPRRKDLICGNTAKSIDAKSGLYGGCFRHSNPSKSISRLVFKEVWAGALSCYVSQTVLRTCVFLLAFFRCLHKS
ncbi:unnamed protein product [Mytilus edulis]|uniref:Reverse transcriptase domain-containing protein n=1 Tax=Mytilus edulis TaxID=6550 RepID=A0A8S3R5S6_MYTED|nr:unnamed protein product [Mytilus edulis]